MSNIVFIRHGETEGNRLQRYIGTTDEHLTQRSIAALQSRTYPAADRLFVSPLTRCVQTARLLYPEMAQEIVPDLRECDFGDFENRNYRELAGNPDYQAWVDSGGCMPFPHGESPEAFRARCVQAFLDAFARREGGQTLAFVVHGGTIMAVLERLALPHRPFYDWRVENGNGYTAVAAKDGTLTVEGKLW